MGFYSSIMQSALNFLSSLFVFAIGILVLVAIYFFIADIMQTRDAVRRNYPVIGRFRYLFDRIHHSGINQTEFFLNNT